MNYCSTCGKDDLFETVIRYRNHTYCSLCLLCKLEKEGMIRETEEQEVIDAIQEGKGNCSVCRKPIHPENESYIDLESQELICDLCIFDHVHTYHD